MAGSNKRRRTRQSLVRWTDEEFTALTAKANKAGLAVAAFMRASALGDAGPRAQRRPTVHKELLILALGLHGRYGNNMNQIAHNGNAGNPVDLPELRVALREWGELRDAMYQALGKTPRGGQSR
jgi:Mobilization protein NikA